MEMTIARRQLSASNQCGISDGEIHEHMIAVMLYHADIVRAARQQQRLAYNNGADLINEEDPWDDVCFPLLTPLRDLGVYLLPHF